MARRPYTTVGKPFRDSDVTVNIKWFPADPAAGCLPYASAINSLDWHTFPTAPLDVGEQWSPTTPAYNHTHQYPFTTGPHVCGTAQDFREGGSYDTSLPVIQYDADGFPLCCGRPATFEGGIAFGGLATSGYRNYAIGGIRYGGLATSTDSQVQYARGGLSFGGLASSVAFQVQPATGGVALGGVAGDVAAQVQPAVGGVTFGGVSESSIITEDVAIGGVTFGGVSESSIITEDVAIGGVTFGGLATSETIDSSTAIGGVTFGGIAINATLQVQPAVGGVRLGGIALNAALQVQPAVGGVAAGGSATVALIQSPVAVGGVAAGGSATVALIQSPVAVGGVTFGGVATSTFTPGTVSPGTNCATAGVLSLGVSQTDTMVAFSADHFYKFNVTSGNTYHIRVTAYTNPGSLSAQVQTSCAGSPTLVGNLFATGCFSFVAGVTGICVIDLSGSLMGTTVCTFICDTGVC